MAKISIRNVMFYGFHGVYEYEREQGQKFYFDVEIETLDERAAETDDVKDAVDYALIYQLVKEVAENKRFRLLEALTAHINEEILRQFPVVHQATTRVRKPSVPISGPIDFVQVETSRTR